MKKDSEQASLCGWVDQPKKPIFMKLSEPIKKIK